VPSGVAENLVAGAWAPPMVPSPPPETGRRGDEEVRLHGGRGHDERAGVRLRNDMRKPRPHWARGAFCGERK